MTFNPFDKEIGELAEADLAELVNRNVAEGYYIEYKGEAFPDNSKIGRSIASLANSYGGWYFVGVETNASNVATNVVGFDLTNYSDPISKVREIVKSHIDPIPRFFVQQINLDGGTRSVLVVYVPSGQDTPFVTKDGRIYRRTHDSSDPIPETNRYAIDNLVEEGRSTRESFAKFSKDERTFSRGEENNTKSSWLNIFIKPFLMRPLDNAVLGKAALQSLLQLSKEQFQIALQYEGISMTGNLPFNNIYQTQRSFVMKQATPYYSPFQSLTVELFYDGRAKLHIPISFTSVEMDVFNELRLKRMGFTSPGILDLFRELMDENYDRAGFELLRFFNIGPIFGLITLLSTFYLDWLKNQNGLVTDLKFALRINGAWRAVPFFDDDGWSDYVREFGFPTGIADTVIFPEDVGRGFKVEAEPKHNLGMFLSEATGLMFGLATEYNQLAFGHYMQACYDGQKKQAEKR